MKRTKKIVRTAAGLRDALFDELDRLREGDSCASEAQATAKLACQIINCVKAEIEFNAHVRALPAGEDWHDGGSLRLGSR